MLVHVYYNITIIVVLTLRHLELSKVTALTKLWVIIFTLIIIIGIVLHIGEHSPIMAIQEISSISLSGHLIRPSLLIECIVQHFLLLKFNILVIALHLLCSFLEVHIQWAYQLLYVLVCELLNLII